jgi:hypothetical protein
VIRLTTWVWSRNILFENPILRLWY